MRCYACDIMVSEGYDKKTDRWYCYECMEPTNRVLLRQLDEEMNNLFGIGDVSVFELDEVDQEGFPTSESDLYGTPGVYASGDEEALDGSRRSVS